MGLLDEARKRLKRSAGAAWRWAKSPKKAITKSRRWRALSDVARKKWRRAKGEAKHQWAKRKKVYRRKYRYFKKKADKPPPPSNGVGYFDGKPVAAWWVPILERARNSYGWSGRLNSGYRTPEYSEQLCYQICGAPSCPGRCAGRSTNHSRLDEDAAVDVSSPDEFARALRSMGRPEHNALGAADPWHFSRSGR